MATSAIMTNATTKGTGWRAAALALAAIAGVATLLALSGSATAGTVIEDSCGETWTLAGSPYILPRGCSVLNLTIEPGVIVEVGQGYGIDVACCGGGRLHAVGTAEQPILFKAHVGIHACLNEHRPVNPPECYVHAPPYDNLTAHMDPILHVDSTFPPVPGWWNGISLNGNGGLGDWRFENVAIESAGFNGCILGFSRVIVTPPDCVSSPLPALAIDGGDLLLKNCDIGHSRGHGIRAIAHDVRIEGCDVHHNLGSGVIVSGYDFQRPWEVHDSHVHDNGGYGIEASGTVGGSLAGNLLERNDIPLRIGGRAAPSGNTFADNARHEIVVEAVASTSVVGDIRWEANIDGPSGAPIVYHVNRLDVAGKLTIDPGAILEVVPDQQIVVIGSGELIARGTAAQPILFTSDSATKAAGQWQGISLQQSADVVLENFTIEATGAFSAPSLRSEGMPRIRIAHCEIRTGLGDALAGPFEVDGCTIHGHTGNGVNSQNARLRNVEIRDNGGVGAILMAHESSVESSSFVRNAKPLEVDARTQIASTNSFDDNGLNRIDIVGGDHHIESRAWPRFVDGTTGATVRYHVRNAVVAQGALTIDAGNVVEFEAGARLAVFGGSIDAIGTETQPILFTSAAENPAPGDWDGIHQRFGDGVLRAHLANVTIEYAATGFYGQGTALVQDCTLRHNEAGAYIDGAAESRLTIERCTIRDNEVGVRSTPMADSNIRGARILDNDVGVKIEGCCGAASFHASDNVFDNDVNAIDPQGVSWAVEKSPAPGGNIIGGPFFGGNAWSDYDGFDCTGDGIGEDAYHIESAGVDPRPLVEPFLDPIAPVSGHALAGPAGNAGWFVGSVTVTLEAEDDLCGVARIVYQLDGALPVVYAGPFAIGTDADHQLVYWAEDKADNVEPPHVVGVKVDKSPPTIVSSRAPPPNAFGWSNTSVTVSFACQDTTSGVFASSPPTTLLSEGAGQSAQGVCTDVAGNAAQATLGGIHIDRTAPQAALMRPDEGMLYVNDAQEAPLAPSMDATSIVVGDLTVEADAMDALSSIAQVRFLVDGRLACVAGADALPSLHALLDGGAAFACLWEASHESLGLHAIEVVAVDRAGNEAVTDARIVRTSATSPEGIVATLPIALAQGREEDA